MAASELPGPQARRNVALLTAATALGAASPPIIISLGGLVGQVLAPDRGLATLPVSLYTLGVALSTIPVALLMRRRGRRAAYVLGAAAGVAAGLLAAAGVGAGHFATFCAATLLAGFYGACVQSYRFAAADGVPAAWRPTAISRVMLGGLAAAVIGPQLVYWTRDALPGTLFAGSFLGQAALALIALPLLLRLQAGPPPAAEIAGPSRPLRVIARQPRFVAAVLAGVVSYALMSFVMTASPIAMVDCGHGVGAAALGIQWHVLAMFAPSFFTAALVRRIGKAGMTALGLVLIAAAGALTLAGLGLLHFWGGLVLLGVGWNFAFVGATALVTDCYQPAERAKVQALNDFLVFGTVALASFGSGRLLDRAGWATINAAILPIAAAVLLVLLAVYRPRAAAGPTV